MERLLLAAPLLAVLIAGEASAHTHLASSSPAEGGTLAADAKEITLSFDGLIDTATCAATDASGRPVAALGAAQPAREVVHVPLSAPLPAGNYALACTYKGTDGHEMKAALKFSVAR